jgi:SAM-dependent MidA family methyltransferase
VIFANEFLDAFPVHRLGWDATQRRWFEWGVGWETGTAVWRRMETPSVPLPNLPPELLAVLPDGFIAESCPAAAAWWKEAAGRLAEGRLLTLDYGLEEMDFFHPARAHGTLRAYCQHQASTNLLARPGSQDLTAHVNFTAVRQAGESAGLITEAQHSQTEFLMPLAARLTEAVTPPWDWSPERRRQLQMLTHPEYLGRRFTVLAQGTKK